MTIRMELGKESYDIILERGCLDRAKERLDLDRKVLIVTDDGVPARYAKTLASFCQKPLLQVIPQGEKSKSLAVFETLLTAMMEAGFTRADCICAVGGGVVGDLAGFAAACYMRGVDFYNIPTTLLSQVDSSIGGKTAVNLGTVKNTVGSFWQPKAVLIDPDTLTTLPKRQIANGAAEALKAGIIGDEALFRLFESGRALEEPDKMIESALRVKKAVVEKDVREKGLRKALNLGHTIGHAIESVTGLLHGECVALGMIPMCAKDLRERLLPILKELGLPVSVKADPEAILAALMHDKKMEEKAVTVVRADGPGSVRLESVTPESLRHEIETVVES